MSLPRRRVLLKRDGYLPFSGSVIASDSTPTASYLAQNTMVPGGPGSPSVGIPLIASGLPSPSTPVTPSNTPTSTVSSSTSSSQIPLGTVIGACVAALVALLLSILLAFYCSRRHAQSAACASSRNTTNNTSRRRSHLEAWKRMDDGREGNEPSSMKQRPPSGSLGAMFHRTISNTSGEKSSIGYNRESIGTMQNFAKYHPGLAAEMASQGVVMRSDAKIAQPPPALLRDSETSVPVSLGEKTVREDSLFSQYSTVPSSQSHQVSVGTQRLTPTATTSSLHHWESAEVLHISQTGSDFADAGKARNPFVDRLNSARSSPRGTNPFFSGQDHLAKRTLLPNIRGNPFADANTPRSSDAIQSLIAALEVPQGQKDSRIVSFRSSLYSRMTTDDESAVSVTAFPYPPAKVNIR